MQILFLNLQPYELNTTELLLTWAPPYLCLLGRVVDLQTYL